MAPRNQDYSRRSYVDEYGFKEGDPISNGAEGVTNAYEQTAYFPRSATMLFYQYKNLRKKLYNQYHNYFKDYYAKDDLMAYIDANFFFLTREYVLSGEVDFAGYIKKKLGMRVQNSYVYKEMEHSSNYLLQDEDTDISALLSNHQMMDEELDYYAAIQAALKNVDLTYLEKLVLYYILEELPNYQIEQNVKKYLYEEGIIGYRSQDIKETIKEMKEFLHNRLDP